MREHNRQATLLSRANPGWSDEQVYQMARKITSAEMSAITYNEFLPALLGNGAMPAYTGYNASVNPSISNAFAAVAFRVGHSMLDDDIERVGANGLTVPQGNLPLRQAFFNPGVVTSFGIDPMLRGFTTRVEQSVDPLIVDDIRNFLFGPPGAGGMDLAAIDIQRARDHGLADYNTMRQDFGLAKVTTFAQITADTTVQAKLQSLYGSVDNIDAFVGTLAEDHLPGSSVGPLTSAMLVDQFNRLRTGDRLFYLNDSSLSPAQIASINNFSLAELIRRNTFVRNIQDNAFVYRHAELRLGLEPGRRRKLEHGQQLVDARPSAQRRRRNGQLPHVADVLQQHQPRRADHRRHDRLLDRQQRHTQPGQRRLAHVRQPRLQRRHPHQRRHAHDRRQREHDRFTHRAVLRRRRPHDLRQHFRIERRTQHHRRRQRHRPPRRRRHHTQRHEHIHRRRRR